MNKVWHMMFPQMWVLVVIFGIPTALVARWKSRSWWIWGLIGVAVAYAIAFFVPVFLGITAPVWLVPFPLLYLLFFASRSEDSYEKSAAAKSLAQGAPYAYVRGGTGIAIDPARRVVRLKNGRTVKEYPFTEVRGWERRLESGGEMVGGYGTGTAAIGPGMAAIGHNIRQSRANRKNSGFFINVSDINHPQWRIDMRSASSQYRWMEILQQTINENRG